MKKIAVILFNLGGPDRKEAIQPFLFNLFSDKAIISLPNPFRWLVAKLISRKRAPEAEKIYAQLGGKSPLYPLTVEQQNALQNALSSSGKTQFTVFTSMRYWHPFSRETIAKVKEYTPDEVILLPLYPQFSTTTSKSSLEDWKREAAKAGLYAKTKAICCYATEKEFINAHVENIKPYYYEASQSSQPRIIFSAHGLPEKVIAAGDPYQWQVEQTVQAILACWEGEKPDYVISYQSRVGPLRWIGPSTEAEILRAGKDKTPVVMVPIAFVSEHSETLVELDIEYKKLAENAGVPLYIRVPSLGTDARFIASLRFICQDVANTETQETYSVYSYACGACPGTLTQCQKEYHGLPGC